MNLKQIIALLIIAVFLSYLFGYSQGAKDMANFGVGAIIQLIKLKKINFDVDEQMIRNGILQYQDNIGGCLFTQNASLYANKRD